LCIAIVGLIIVLVFGTNACRLLWVEKSWVGPDHHHVFLSFVGFWNKCLSVVVHFIAVWLGWVGLLSSLVVVAHVGQEGPNWAKMKQ
jgi:hypothetical protein